MYTCTLTDNVLSSSVFKLYTLLMAYCMKRYCIWRHISVYFSVRMLIDQLVQPVQKESKARMFLLTTMLLYLMQISKMINLMNRTTSNKCVSDFSAK